MGSFGMQVHTIGVILDKLSCMPCVCDWVQAGGKGAGVKDNIYARHTSGTRTPYSHKVHECVALKTC